MRFKRIQTNFFTVLLLLSFVLPAWAGTTSGLSGITGKIGKQDIEWGTGESNDTFNVPTYQGGSISLERVPSLFSTDSSKIKDTWYVSSAPISNHADATIKGSLAWVMARVGLAEATVDLPAGTYNVGSDLTIPSTICLRANHGSLIRVDGVTVTIGKFEAGLSKVFDCVNGGHVFFTKEAVKAALPQWWGAKADWDSNTRTGTDNEGALEAAAQSYPVTDLGDGDYGVLGTFDITTDTTLLSKGAGIHKFPQADGQPNLEVVLASGTIEAYAALGADAEAGTNRINCPSLTASVKQGDLLKLTSDKTYDTGPDGFLYAGEMQLVHEISGPTYIRLGGALNDSYLLSENAQVAIVRPIHFDVVGELNVRQYPVAPTQRCRGITIRYTINTKGTFNTFGCSHFGMMVSTCYAPDIKIFSGSNYYEDTTNSYGLAIDDSTMNGRFTGVVAGARHAFKTGGAPAWRGISWNNHVYSAIGYGLSTHHVFDAHGGTGSIYYEDCTAIGGDDLYNSDESGVAAGGWQVGAKYNYIRNCTYIGAGVGVGTRAFSPDINTLEVNGLNLTEASIAVSASSSDGKVSVPNLIVKNINGKAKYGLSITGNTTNPTQIDRIEMSDVHILGNRLLNLESSTNTILPSIITVNDSSCESIGVTDSGIIVSGPTTLQTLVLNNVRLKGQEYSMRINAGLSRLELNQCRFTDSPSVYHILATGASIGELVINGGYYSGPTSSVCRVATAGNNIGKLTVVGATIQNATALVSAATGSSLNAAFIGPNDMPSVANVANLYGAGYLEYLSGGQLGPSVVRGFGSPEGVVAMPVGSEYINRSGTTNTVRFLKETGTGSTGWVAK